ncbi:hypothetical protein MFLAVUS_002630 [Mucor flavus]|uniref:Uncharacterized protein n=1 Tax=Mucor flavus TaxID=439312 RepID=A0ABP9YQW8_9FUNG
MKRRLARTIQDCIDSGKSLADLKNQCLNKKRLDRGIMTGVEERMGARAAEIEKMLRKRRKTQTPLQCWFEPVESDFDRLVSDYQKEAKGKGKEVEVLSQKIEEINLIEEDEYGESSSRAIPKIQTGKAQNQSEESSDDPTESDLNEEDDEKTRSCSASLLPLIRSDLPADIKDKFLRVLERKLTAATDYTIDFGVQVRKTINLLRASTFVKDGNSVKIRQERGPRLQDVLPTNYQLEEKGDIFLPSPLDFSCLETANLARNFSKLFSKAHLQLIHSTYFSPQGLREGSTKTQYFHNAFVGILPRNIKKKAFTTDPYVMKMCLSKYKTNFEVMWSNSKKAFESLESYTGYIT